MIIHSFITMTLLLLFWESVYDTIIILLTRYNHSTNYFILVVVTITIAIAITITITIISSWLLC